MKSLLSFLVVSLFSLCSLTNAQWVQTGLSGNRVNSIVVSNNNLFAGTNGNGVYISTNNGLSWSATNNGLTNTFVRAITFSGANLFAGTYGGGIFRSTDNGVSWNTANNGVTNSYVLTFAVNDTNLYACTESASGNVFRSTNHGLNWSLANNGVPSTIVHSLNASGTNLFAGTFSSGVWKRPLSEIVPVEFTSFSSIVTKNNVTLNWSTATETNNSGFQIERSEIHPNRNKDWVTIGFVRGFGTTAEPKSYSFIDKNLSSGKYGYRLKQVDFDGTFEYSKTIEVDVVSPIEFFLEQNYPNPFNPTTNIRFRISDFEFVTCKVYDILGNEVATLINEEKSAGSYSIEFNASELSSGTYIYKLQAGNNISIRKMILLK